MLTPKQLKELPDNVVKLYEELEDDIIRDMARRIVKTNFATGTAQWQLIQLQRMGATHDEVFNKLSKATNKSDEELISMFNEAAQTAYNSDIKAYIKAGYNSIPLAENAQLQRIINAGLAKTQALFQNLTNTTANTASQQFENALDTAYMQITSGAFDYNTAIRNCIKTLSDKGIASITYPSGHTDYLDVAVRRAALTGVGQTTGEMQIALAKEMGSDLVEVTAHNGARPSHMAWQGKVYSLSGKHPKYPDFYKATGYGTGAGLKGWGCRHDFFPFFEGDVPSYTQEELAEYENKKVTYNGVEMTEYEASQRQRAMERRIRATKRELAGYDSAIKETDNQDLKDHFQAEFDRKSVRLKKQEAKLKDFTNQTGLTRDRSREQVPAHYDTKQGKTVAFNKSVSQKAVWANKKNNSSSHRNANANNKPLDKAYVENLGYIGEADREKTVQDFISKFVLGDDEVTKYEHMLVIAENGQGYYVTNYSPNSLGNYNLDKEMKNSYNIHTHPKEYTQYTFSIDSDIPAFFNDGSLVMEACDYKYRYRFERPENVTLDDWEEARFEAETKAMKIMDKKGFSFEEYQENYNHIIISETCRILGINVYKRWKI